MSVALLVVVFGASLGLNAALIVMVRHLWASENRCYGYAVDQAARFDVTDPRGQAYSDMATVIALDGKAEPKEWTR